MGITLYYIRASIQHAVAVTESLKTQVLFFFKEF